MRAENYTTSFTVDQTPAEVFAAILNVRAWWEGDITGDSAKLGDSFTYSHPPQHRSTQKINEFVPGRRIVWHITDAELTFVDDRSEWTGTDIVFEITPKDGKTELRFTHIGLVPEFECFTDCSSAWGFYINSCLRNFIATGSASPELRQAASIRS